MANSGIGGQAVIEGIMMRNRDKYSLAVRKPDQEIEVLIEPYKGVVDIPALYKVPIIRGVLAFLDSLVVGMRTLMVSADYFAEEEEDEEEKKKKEAMTAAERARQEKKEERMEKMMMTGTLIFSIVIVVFLFMMLPYFISDVIGKVITSKWLISLSEAILRVLIFIVYLVLVSQMKDIKRTFMYHGAEHKCINCIENGWELTTANVMKSSRFHKRCGTSFLVYVILISAVLLMFVQAESHVMRVVIRLLLVPVIAGVSYEFIRAAGRSDNKIVNALSRPGLAMQKLTTKEPDESQVEVAIKAVEAVFDWEEFQKENFTHE
ncbi:MAG: DUF1385 domain-containing protein [Eubacteriales bacterium]|nr:DUF1385 domain-containing protein [Eubacteriales bacterium]